MCLLERFTIDLILDFKTFFNKYLFLSNFVFLFDLFLLVKLPQIMKIVNAGSGQGISLIAVMCELFAISATTTYGYAMSFPFRCD